MSRSDFVSGGGSADTRSGDNPRRPAVPATTPLTNSRRLQLVSRCCIDMEHLRAWTRWSTVQYSSYRPSAVHIRFTVSGARSASAQAWGWVTSRSARVLGPRSETPRATAPRQRRRGRRGVGVASSSLQLLPQLVEEAPVGPLGDDPLGAGFDHARLVEAEGVEAHRVLRLVLAPAVIGDALHRLERKPVFFREPSLHDEPGRTLRIGGAEVGGLEQRSQGPLGRHGVLADEVAVRGDGAAEVLGPGPIHRAVHDDA